MKEKGYKEYRKNRDTQGTEGATGAIQRLQLKWCDIHALFLGPIVRILWPSAALLRFHRDVLKKPPNNAVREFQ